MATACVDRQDVDGRHAIARHDLDQPAGLHILADQAFEQDAAEFAELGKTPLPMPMLVLSGEKAGGTFLIAQGRMVATDVQGVIVKGSGHWLMEEAPDQVIPALINFLG